MDRDIIRHEPERSQKLEPEVDGAAEGHFPEGEKAEHGEVEKVSSVADLVEVADAQARLAVCDCSNLGRIGEEGLVLLHSSAAEERGIVMRPYGFNAYEINALGKAEVLILLDQASRGDIGNLLRCSCAFGKYSDLVHLRQSAARLARIEKPEQRT
jgi:hypothetical protein